jgi:two-component system phosphate regulon response regulator PhoB
MIGREGHMNSVKRVLIVDDEPDLLKSLTFRIRKSGYEVIEAISGEEALEKASESKPAIILLDWRLPGISGTEVYKRLKVDLDLEHIPVIFLTASREQAELEKLKQETGEANIVTKPYEYKDLLAKIRDLIGE